MPDSNINFAKIVANPNTTSWAQAYNAGKLFAVISLEKETKGENPEESLEDKIEDKDFLAILGKEVLDTLESEYFALEDKNLDSVKNAIIATSKKIPENIRSSFVITSLAKNVLYVFVFGSGKIYLKRNNNFGLILNLAKDEENNIKGASGYVMENDIVILETNQFSNLVPSEKLTSILDNLPPNEIAETLAPIIHRHNEGGAASIIMSFKEVPKDEQEVSAEEEYKKESEEDRTLEEELIKEAPVKTVSYNKFAILGSVNVFLASFLKKIVPKKPISLSHSKRMYLSITVIILVVLITSIIFAINKQNEAKTKALFEQVYPVALKKYDEGKSLEDLNQNLARDSFVSAKKILEDGKEKFDKNSKEEQQILELLVKIEESVKNTSKINTVKAKEVGKDQSEFLKFVEESKAVAFAKDSSNIYSIDKDGVYSTTKGKENTKEIIKNEDYWKNPVGVFPYLSNIYVLDKTKGGVIKFVGGSEGFGQINYFTDSEPDLKNAKSIAIDGSIWILLSDGTILKFTKGKADAFNLTGVDSPLSNPSKIYTDVDSDYVYVLDNGNSRIVVLEKNGNYKEQYSSNILSSAKEFEVLENDKKVLVLSSGKIYEIDLK